MVVAGIDCVAGEHPDLGRLRLPLVENFEIVVSRSSIQGICARRAAMNFAAKVLTIWKIRLSVVLLR